MAYQISAREARRRGARDRLRFTGRQMEANALKLADAASKAADSFRVLAWRALRFEAKDGR